MRLRLFLVLIIFLCISWNAPAQEEPAVDTNVSLSDPTKSQLSEAKSVLDKCLLNADMYTRHNCKCFSLQYLEKRVQSGDAVRPSEIFSSLRNVCLNSNQKEMEDLGYNDMSDVPQEVLDEGKLFNENCKNNHEMSTSHDCDCLAGKLIGDRLKLGPLISLDGILSKYQGVCKNSVGMAGMQFTKCMDNYEQMVPRNIKPKYYCDCYASEYAKSYGSFEGQQTSDDEVNFDVFSRAKCTKKMEQDSKYLR